MRRAALDQYLRRAGRACRPSGERRGRCRGTCARPRYEARRSETARSADERSRRRQFRSVFLKCMATELRRERREKQKRKRQPRRSPQSSGILNQLLIGGVVVLAIVLGFAGLRAAGVFEPPPPPADVSGVPQLPPGATIGTKVDLLPGNHIPVGQTGHYNSEPPTSGEHWSSSVPPAPAPWGIKDSMLQREVTTHNLEHGGIVIAYNNLSAADTDKLKGVLRALPGVEPRDDEPRRRAMLRSEGLAVRAKRDEAVVALRELDGRVRGEALLAVRDDELRLGQRLGELDDLREGDPFPPLVQTRPRRDAVHVRDDRRHRELLEFLPVEGELVQHLAEHPEAPRSRIEARHRAVVQHRPLLGEVLAGRHALADLLGELALLGEVLHERPAARRSILNV